MIEYEQYKKLYSFCGYSCSWAVWDAPADGNWRSKSRMGDVPNFDNPTVFKQLHSDYILVGLNKAKHDLGENRKDIPWADFHSPDTRRSQDYKMRYAFHEIEYAKKYWGCFITDVYPNIIETDSNKALLDVTAKDTEKAISSLLDIWEILGSRSTIVAFGNDAANELLKYKNDFDAKGIKLLMIRHYSASGITEFLETLKNPKELN